MAEISNATNKEGFVTTTSDPDRITSTPAYDINEFHETTTNRYGSAGESIIGEGDGNNVKYSKIGYAFREFQQEVENSCGRKYYSDYLSGHSLTITASVFGNECDNNLNDLIIYFNL